MDNQKIYDFMQMMYTEIVDIKEGQTELNIKVSRIEDDVAVLKTDVSGLKTDVSGLKTDVSALKTDVSALKTDVSALKTDVVSLKERQTILEVNQLSTLNKLDSFKIEIKQEFDKMDTKTDSLNKSIIRLENTQKEKYSALFDGHTQTNIILKRLESKIDAVDKKVDNQEVVVKYLKRVK